MSKTQLHKLSQIEVDMMLKKVSVSIQELEAQRKLEAQNKAFDHFVNTGEVIEVKEVPHKTIVLDSLTSIAGGENLKYYADLRIKVTKKKK